jgi:uncharacterized protein (TIGR00369 family)
MPLEPVMSLVEVDAFLDREFPQFRALGGYSLTEIAPGRATMVLEADESHLRPGATVSGPTLFTLADVGAYAVLLAHIGPVPLIVTTSMSINFMRRPPAGRLVAECEILKLGKRLAVVEVGIRGDGAEDLLVRATGTYSVPPA